MNIKRFMVILGGVCLAAVIVFSWGCQNQPTGPELSNPLGTKTRSYESGSCSSGITVNFSGSKFLSGHGWSTGAGRNISFSGSCSGCNYFGVYGWMTNPRVEYYIGRSGSSSYGSYTCDGRSHTLYRDNKGGDYGYFYNVSGSGSSPVDFGCHTYNWNRMGVMGTHNYQVVAGESWSGGSGTLRVSTSGANWYTHWVNEGSASFSCDGGGGGGSTTTTTTTSGGGGGGSCTMTLRARSTDGSGRVKLVVGGKTCGDWTLGSSMSNKSVTLWSSKGDCYVEFTNDASGRDVQIDYLQVCGSTRQAESQGTNTGVWQNGSCGGSNSEWLHCNGYIGFGNVSY